MKKIIALGMVVALAMSSLVGCGGKSTESTGVKEAATAAGESTAAKAKSVFDGARVRIVIGSTSTTGDSYMIADTTNRYLSKALNMSSKVDAVGAGPALDAVLTADPDGSTMMLFHDMAYLGVTFGAFDEEYSLDNMIVGPRVATNPGSAFAATASAPYNDMGEMAEYLKANPKEVARLAVEAGGVSHVAFVAYYNWVVEKYGQDVADRVKVVIGGSTAEKSQMLWDGNCDAIFADYTSLLSYTEEGVDAKIKMKYLALLDTLEGSGVKSFADEGITYNGAPFVFSKDFVFYLPKETPQAVIDELDAAVAEICKDQEFIDALAKLNYKADYLPSAESKTHIYEKKAILEDLIKNSPSLDDLTL